MELAIRLALGAPTGSTVRLAMAEGLRWVVTGLVAGLIVALGAMPFALQVLYEARATAPITLAGTTVALLALGTAACWLPARRVERIDPVATLRGE